MKLTLVEWDNLPLKRPNLRRAYRGSKVGGLLLVHGNNLHSLKDCRNLSMLMTTENSLYIGHSFCIQHEAVLCDV